MLQRVVHSDEEWKELLTPGQYFILRQAGTELPRSRWDEEASVRASSLRGSPDQSTGASWHSSPPSHEDLRPKQEMIASCRCNCMLCMAVTTAQQGSLLCMTAAEAHCGFSCRGLLTCTPNINSGVVVHLDDTTG